MPTTRTLLYYIVAGGKTWVDRVNNCKTKQNSWNGDTQSPNKLRQYMQKLSARNLVAMVVWDREGVLLVDFFERGSTIYLEKCETL